MMFTDTHTHLLDDRFDETREQIIRDFEENKIDFVIECGTDEKDSRKAALLAAGNSRIFAAVGVHPHSASEFSDQTEREIAALAKMQKVVAIGEIGLDFHYDFSPRKVQQDVFARQIALGKRLDLPIVVHSREAAEPTFEMLKEAGRGVLHCFSGSAEMAVKYVERGFYIAFGGSVTFKNARKTVETAQIIPLDRILIETDCPYLSPEPKRGQTNQPANVRYVAAKLAEIRGISIEEIADAAKKNAMRLFAIKEA